MALGRDTRNTESENWDILKSNKKNKSLGMGSVKYNSAQASTGSPVRNQADMFASPQSVL